MSFLDVEYHLEQMLPEVNDLLSKGIFTDGELKQIIKKRRDFEYSIHRSSPIQQDFINYIQFEKNLEKLRKLRKKKKTETKTNNTRNNATNNATKQFTISDYSLVRRIHSLYQKALTFFPSKSLFLCYFNWSKLEKSSRTLGKNYAKAIQLFPRESWPWIQAAEWEVEQGSGVGGARVLLQRGVRINPECETLWHAYFALEVDWISKLMQRREILFKENGPENELLNENENNRDGSLQISDTNQELSSQSPDIIQPAVLSEYKVPLLVLTHSLRALATPSVGYLRQQLDTLEAAPDSKTAVENVEAMIKSHCGTMGINLFCQRPMNRAHYQGQDRNSLGARLKAVKECHLRYRHSVSLMTTQDQETAIVLRGMWVNFLASVFSNEDHVDLLRDEWQVKAFMCVAASEAAGGLNTESVVLDLSRLVELCGGLETRRILEQESKGSIIDGIETDLGLVLERGLQSNPSSVLLWTRFCVLKETRDCYEQAVLATEMVNKTSKGDNSVIWRMFLGSNANANASLGNISSQPEIESLYLRCFRVFGEKRHESLLVGFLEQFLLWEAGLEAGDVFGWFERLLGMNVVKSNKAFVGVAKLVLELENKRLVNERADDYMYNQRVDRVWEAIHAFEPGNIEMWVDHLKFLERGTVAGQGVGGGRVERDVNLVMTAVYFKACKSCIGQEDRDRLEALYQEIR